MYYVYLRRKKKKKFEHYSVFLVNHFCLNIEEKVLDSTATF